MFKITFSLISFFLFIGLGHLSSQPWIEWTGKENPNFYEIQDAFYAKADELGLDKREAVYKKYKRWEHYWSSRLTSSGHLYMPENNSFQLIDQDKNTFDKHNDQSDWSLVGPDSSQGRNFGNGRINTIAFDPGDANRWLVGMPLGGIWETRNAGGSWTPLTDRLSILQPIGITDIEFAPSNRNIVYAATGDGYGTDAYSLGVMKSTDGGSTWAETNWQTNLTDFWLLREIIVHPTDPDLVYAAGNGGIIVSTDGGDSWDRTLTDNCYDIVFKPNSPSTIYASADEKVYRSTDAGITWAELTNGLPSSNSLHRIELAVTPDDPDYLYVLAANFRNLHGVYRSTNGGNSFSARHTSTNILGYHSDGSDTGGQAFYDLAIEVSPTNKNEVYVGGINLQKSTDGGQNWEAVAMWTGWTGHNKNSSPVIHADQHSLHFKPNTSILYITNDGGLFSTSNGGSSYTWLAEGLAISQFYDFDVQTINPKRIIGGTQDNGTQMLLDDGNWYVPLGGDGFVSHIDPNDDDNMFCALYYGEISGSGDGGQNFIKLTFEWDSAQSDWVNKTDEEGAWETPYIMSAQKSSTMLVGYYNVWKSNNFLQEDDYQRLTNFSHTNTIRVLDMSPVDSNRIVFSFRNSNSNSIYKTTDGGTTWDQITSNSNQPLQEVVFHSSDSDKLWLIYGGYSNNEKVYYSDDFGSTFTNQSQGLANIPALDGAHQAGSNNRLWLGNDRGVFYRDDNSNGWVEYSKNLPYTSVRTVVLDGQNQKIYAGTYGRSIWVSDLPVDITIPTLISPANDSEYISIDTTLAWSGVSNATGYDWQLASDEQFTQIVASGDSISNTSVVTPTLSYYTEYNWRVRSVNGNVISPWTDTWSFRTTVPPTTLVSPTDGSEGLGLDTVLTWTNIAGAGGYILELSQDNTFTNIDYTSNSLSTNEFSTTTASLEFEKEYFWRVKVIYPGGETAYSTPFSFKTKLSPVNLISPVDSIGGLDLPVSLLWSSNPAADSYSIEYATESDFSASTATVENITDTTYINQSLQPSTMYYWRAKAVDVESESDWSVTEAFRTGITTPTLVSPADMVQGADPFGVDLVWDSYSSSVADSLEIFSDANLQSRVFTRSLTHTTFNFTNMTGGVTYYWRVMSYDGFDYSEWSDTFSFTTKLPGFSLSSPLNGSKTLEQNGELTWSESMGASSYSLQLSTDSQFNNLLLDTTDISGLTYDYSSLELGTTYYWRVRATANNIETDWTDTWSFTTIYPALSLTSPDNNAIDIEQLTPLVWGTIPGAEYDLVLGNDETLNSPLVEQTVNQASYTPTTELGTRYYWKVRYQIAGGYSEWSDTWNFTTVPPLGSISITAPTSGVNKDTFLTARWTALSGVDSYELELNDLSDNSVVESITGIKTNEREISGLSYNSDYRLRVRGIKPNDTSDWEEVEFGTKLSMPERTTPERGGIYEAVFSSFQFQSVDGADEYRFQISYDLNGDNIIYDTVISVLDYVPSIINDMENGEYWWNLVAQNSEGRISDNDFWKFDFKALVSVGSYLEIEYGLTVFPNPNNGLFTLAANKNIPYEIKVQVYNTAGEYISSYSFDKGVNLISGRAMDISGLPSGAYNLYIEAGPHKGIISVIIE